MGVSDTHSRPRRGRRVIELTFYLAFREFRIRYQAALLGWLWAVAPTAARFVVLGAVFSALLNEGPNYVTELAIGVLAWDLFSSGVANATASAVNRADLLTYPTLPRQVIPVVSVLTDLFDYLAAFPVLLCIVLIDTGQLPLTGLLVVPIIVLQCLLVLGLGMAASVADVRWRDARLAVQLVLSVGLFLTPVFYSVRALSDEFIRELVSANPMAMIITAQRELLVEGNIPSLGSMLILAVICLSVFALGWTVYGHRSATFLDHL